VAAAVRGFNAIAPGGPVPRPELLIVARGGGSVEDLWAFNEEVAVRAVAESRIPVIAAVGHETDWTLIDHAADLRAPTPTGAAEMAVPVRAELMAATRELASRHELAERRFMATRRRDYVALCRALPSLGDLLALPRQKLDEIGGRLGRALRGNVERPRRQLDEIGGRLGRSLGTEIAKKRKDFSAAGPRLSPFVLERALGQRRERLSVLSGRLGQANSATLRRMRRDFGQLARRHDVECIGRIVTRQRQRWEQAARLLRSYSYESVLDRGFALVLDPRGKPLRAANQVATGDLLSIRLAEGDLAAFVSDGAPPRSRRTPKQPPQPATASQGSLF
jgi:exodeoxyribonuclease VII large subunit